MPQPVLIVPQGRLDAASVRPLQAELDEHLANGSFHLIVDFKDTRYISSNGMRILLAAHKQSQQHGGSLKLCSLNPYILEIFAMAGFDRIFEIFDTYEQAAAAFPG